MTMSAVPLPILLLSISCIVVVLFSVVATATPVLDPSIVYDINSDKSSTWRARFNPRFRNAREEDVKRMLATSPPPTEGYTKEEQQIVNRYEQQQKDKKIPSHFDSRSKWPHCIHPIRDQGECGSCWAFSASEVLSDRFCIYSNRSASHQNVNVVLAPQDLVSCDYMDLGCGGGNPVTAWLFMEEWGIVPEWCFPYVSGQKNGTVPSCLHQNTCKNSKKTFDSQKYYVESTWHVCPWVEYWKRVETMQKEIMKNGPIQGTMYVYKDFMHYASGVYKHTKGHYLGGHAIKIVGWGSENNSPYWLVANSWGFSWGMNGFFKILRGSNECGIESECRTGSPNLSNLPPHNN